MALKGLTLRVLRTACYILIYATTLDDNHGGYDEKPTNLQNKQS